MDRRSFVKATSALSLSATLPAFAQAPVAAATAQTRVFNPKPGDWRSFEVTHRVELLKPAGTTKVWLPIPVIEDGYQRNLTTDWKVSSGKAQKMVDANGVTVLMVEFDGKEAKQSVEMTTKLQTQSRSVDLSKPGNATISAADAKKWTAATALMPTDGIVLTRALEATKGRTTEIEKVRGIYEWTIANTYRNVDAKGCGVGDVKAALEVSNFGGKCADNNAIFVALCRAVGIPARDVYGVRIAPSVFGYKELGAGSANITKAQHCRAEVFLTGYGWVPMDPADVGKVQRVETKEWIKTVDHPVVAPVHTALFGAWEGNWMAYNTAHDVVLPGAKGPQLAFLMYPQGETADGRLDPYDPDNFKYTITTKEVKATA